MPDPAWDTIRVLARENGFPQIDQFRIRRCAGIDAANRITLRAAGHVGHILGVICVRSGFRRLSYATRLGVLAHEVGHLIAVERGVDDGGHGRPASERAANRMARTILGIEGALGPALIQRGGQIEMT